MKRVFLISLVILMTLAITTAVMAENKIVEIQRGSIDYNRYGDTFAYKASGSSYYKIIDRDGHDLTPAIYISLFPRDEFYKAEVSSIDGVHDEGLLAADGTVIIPPEYADIVIINSRWQIGIKLTPSSSDDKDYTFTNYTTDTKSYYRVQQADFFFDGKKAGSLDRSQYGESWGNAYGAYIRIKNRAGKNIYYNSKMEPSPYESEYSGEYDNVYKNRSYTYYHQGTGQIAFVPECTLTPEEVENPYLFVDYTMYDLQGNVVFTTDKKYDRVTPYVTGYFQTTAYSSAGGSSRGFIDAEGKEVIPAEYDSFGYNEYPFLYGYVSAVKDDKFGFLDSNGNVTCDFTYASNIVQDYGTFAKLNDLSGNIIVLSAAVGELPERYKDVQFAGSNGSLAFVAEKLSGEKCLINIYGEELIPCSEDYRDIAVNADATTALITYPYDYDHYDIVHLDPTRTAVLAQPEPAGQEPLANGLGFTLPSIDDIQKSEETPNEVDSHEDETWTCSNGHSGNIGNFCPICGEPKPEPEDDGTWTCSNGHSGNTGNFCPICGEPKP